MGNNRPTGMIRAPGNTSSILLSWYPDQCSMIAISDLVTWVRRSSELAGWLSTPECTLSAGHRWNLKKGRQCNAMQSNFCRRRQFSTCLSTRRPVNKMWGTKWPGRHPESWRNYKVGKFLGTSWLVSWFHFHESHATEELFLIERLRISSGCWTQILEIQLWPTFWNDQLGLNSLFQVHHLAWPGHRIQGNNLDLLCGWSTWYYITQGNMY